MTGLLTWGQAGEYNAVDDRGVIAALAGTRRGLSVAPPLTAGAGLNVMVGPFLGVFNAGDGTAIVARNDEIQAVPIAAGPGTGSRTDVLWLDLDPEDALWEILPLPAASTVGRLGASLGTVTMPTGANTAAQATLAPAFPSYERDLIVQQWSPAAQADFVVGGGAVAISPVNTAITFVIPPSGRVMARWSAFCAIVYPAQLRTIFRGGLAGSAVAASLDVGNPNNAMQAMPAAGWAGRIVNESVIAAGPGWAPGVRYTLWPYAWSAGGQTTTFFIGGSPIFGSANSAGPFIATVQPLP